MRNAAVERGVTASANALLTFQLLSTARRVLVATGNLKAVGAANGRNPVAIIVPCHQIIGSGGRPKLTGYGGVLWSKEWLLRHEGALLVYREE